MVFVAGALYGIGGTTMLKVKSWYNCASVNAWWKCRRPPVTCPCRMKCQVSSPNTDSSLKVCLSSCWKVRSFGPLTNRQFGNVDPATKYPVHPCATARSGEPGFVTYQLPKRV